MKAALVADPPAGWASDIAELVPGGHLVLLTSDEGDALEGRRAGLELRDTLLILLPGPLGRFGFLFRQPLSAKNVTENILQHGTGGLNIGACRVSVAMDELVTQSGETVDTLCHEGYERPGRSMYVTKPKERSGPANVLGRWPSNLVLVHADGCLDSGTKRIAAASGVSKNRPITAIRRSGAHTGAGGHQRLGRVQPVFGYGDDEGLETVTAWECAAGCPVKLLDEQSGIRPSTLTGKADPLAAHSNPGDNHGSSLFGGGNSNVYADSGSASRFYPTFASVTELTSWVWSLIGDS